MDEGTPRRGARGSVARNGAALLPAAALLLAGGCVEEKAFEHIAGDVEGDADGGGEDADGTGPDGGETGACESGPGGLCDDGDACTVDVCDEVAGCLHTDAVCDDGDACNGLETCKPSKGCTAGTPLDCDDGLECTGVETCAKKIGCVPGTPPAGCCASDGHCDEGNPCNGAGQCELATGTCVLVAPPACDDGDPCNGVESCSAAAKGCVLGTTLVCDDGNVCNGVEACESGKGCAPGVPLGCDDHLPCNGLESCDPKAGCVVGAPLPGCCKAKVQCEDGNVCNGDGSCDLPTETCVVDPPSACNDGNPCNGSEACLPSAGCSAGVPLACGDGNPCTGLEGCDPETGCTAGSPQVCDDEKACNGLESCDPVKGCIPGTALTCFDGNPCNGNESCDQETGCQGGDPLDCDDGDACTTDACDPVLACTHAPVGCDDGKACTDDGCSAAAGCTHVATDCDDGDACNGAETCLEGTGCAAGTALSCDDGDACNGVETCGAESGCLPGIALDCDDGDACNGIESCDDAGGCKLGLPITCDDGDLCNGLETCDATLGCEPASLAACDDGLACTGVETCDEVLGCTAGTPLECDDGSPCNGLETCDDESGCVPGEPPPDCDDGDACNGVEACDKLVGCAAGTAPTCDDGDACNGAETCDAETGCVPGTPPDCDDGNPCTDDACDEETDGLCVHDLAASCGLETHTWTFDPDFEYETTDGLVLEDGEASLATGDPRPLDLVVASGGLVALYRLDVPAPKPGDPGLVASFDLDEEAWTGATGEVEDALGGPPGTAGAGAENVPGLLGRAALLDPGETVTIDSAGLVASGPFSVTAWVRIDDDAKPDRMPVAERWEKRVAMTAGAFDAYDAAGTDGVDVGGYSGAAFDGRYVVFAPQWKDGVAHGRVLRLDTTLPFGETGSWDAYDAGETGGLLTVGYSGAGFDGRYVYFAPLEDGVAGSHGHVLRLDTKGDFHDEASWASRDAGSTDGLATTGMAGTLFDGRFLHIVPNLVEETHGRFLRLDTARPFDQPSSWNARDSGTTSGLETVYFFGQVFDGRHAYFSQHEGSDGLSAHVLRLDTTAAFPRPESWTAYDAAGAGEKVVTGGFRGGSFDGRYAYFIDSGRNVVRFDTSLGFEDAGAWSSRSVLGLAGVSPSLKWTGGIFDGRFVTWVPSFDDESTSGLVLRQDTTAAFEGDDSAWTTFDAAEVGGLDTTSYRGGAFDGRYVYFAPRGDPGQHARVLRFDTAGPGASWSLLAAQPGQDGAFSGGPLGPAAVVETDKGHFVAAAPARLERGAHHLAMTWNGASVRLYVDGAEVSVRPAPGKRVAGAVPVTLGGDGFDGVLDAVGFWSKALSASDIETLARPSAADAASGHHGTPGEAGAGPGMSLDFGQGLTAKPGAAGPTVPQDAAFDPPESLTVEAWVKWDPSRIGGGSIATRRDPDPPLDASVFAAYDADGTGGLPTRGYVGGAFDGRYVYFAPEAYGPGGNSGIVLRHDPTLDFDDPAAWEAFDASATGGLASKGFIGATFDGRYVYFAPHHNGTTASGVVLRYDTTKAFDVGSSWEAYDASGTDALDCRGFYGAVFDGQYVTFVPHGVAAPSGVFLRYDTQKPFQSASSWDARDASSTGGLDTRIFVGGVFDGRYLVAVPSDSDGAGYALRFDTTLPFDDPAAWQAFDQVSTDGLATDGFFGGAFDGRHTWLVPRQDGGIAHARVLRLDPSRPFLDPSSWDAHDAVPATDELARGFAGAVYDGRFLHFVPLGGADTGAHGHVLRYDASAPFEDESSWAAVDAGATGGLETQGYWGGVFDGRYVYLSPYDDGGYHGRALRLDTSPEGAGWMLLPRLPAQDGAFSGAPPGPFAAVETTEGRFTVAAPAALTKGWHHLALVWDGFDLALWVDGSLATKTKADGSLFWSVHDLQIAAGRFEGVLDEVAVFAETVSPEALASRVAPYVAGPEAVTALVPISPPSGEITGFTAFSAIYDNPSTSEVRFQVSTDGGDTWRAWDDDGGTWAAVPDGALSPSSDPEAMVLHVADLPPGPAGLLVRGILTSPDPAWTPALSAVTVDYTYAP